MLELNKIHLCDCLEGFKQLDDNSIDLIVTSPPYNLGDKKGGQNNLWNSNIDYENYTDARDEDDYQNWQLDLLKEMYRVLKPGGSLFYNHKVRSRNNQGILPSSWLLKSDLTFRQLIIWDRMGSVNVNITHYLPTTELIYWMTKGTENVRFSRQTYQLETGKNRGQIVPLTEVWQVKADMDNDHPAPFSLEIPMRIIPSVMGGDEMMKKYGNIIVLDPFMGSGTTAIAAKRCGANWIGFEMSEKYINMANQRIDKYFADQSFGENLFGEENTTADDFSYEEMMRKKKEEEQEKHKVKNIKNKPKEEVDGDGLGF